VCSAVLPVLLKCVVHQMPGSGLPAAEGRAYGRSFRSSLYVLSVQLSRVRKGGCLRKILKIRACKSPAAVFQMLGGGGVGYMDIRASPNATSQQRSSQVMCVVLFGLGGWICLSCQWSIHTPCSEMGRGAMPCCCLAFSCLAQHEIWRSLAHC